MGKDLRAFTVGFLVFAVLSAAYLAIATEGPGSSQLSRWLARAIIYSAPLLAGGACALLRPQRPVETLFALGVGAAACFTGLDFAWTRFGYSVNLGGMSPLPSVLGVSLMTMPLLVFAGGVLGMSLRSRLAH